MKGLGILVLGVALMGLGCMPPSFLRHDPPPAKAVEIKPPPAPPIVTPDSVNETNATDRARALREEMEHDARQKNAPPSQGN